jgi:hypothetical protein
MFLLPRKRRSTAATLEAATPNQRVKLTPLESHTTLVTASSSPGPSVGPPATTAAVPPRESVSLTHSGERTLFPSAWARASPGEVLIVDGKRVYPCRVCGFRFSASSNRNRHERNKHAGESANEQAIAVPTQRAGSEKEKNEHVMDVSCEDVIMVQEEQHEGDANETMNESSAGGDSPDSVSSSSEPLDADMIDTPSTSDLGSEATSVSASALTELANAPPFEPLGVLALMQDTHLQSDCAVI